MPLHNVILVMISDRSTRNYVYYGIAAIIITIELVITCSLIKISEFLNFYLMVDTIFATGLATIVSGTGIILIRIAHIKA